MPDPFEALHAPDTPADPDPAFRVLADGHGHIYAVSAQRKDGRIAWNIRTLRPRQ